MNESAQGEAIFLDNQRLKVAIFVSSGLIQVFDPVAGVEWNMDSQGCAGRIVVQAGDQAEVFHLGKKGEDGVLFQNYSYLLRSLGEDDYHDVCLSGSFGSDRANILTIRYLLSNTFPVLNCFCYIRGEVLPAVKEIHFPHGFLLPHTSRNHVYLPAKLNAFQDEESTGWADCFSEPDPKGEHVVAGAPFYVLTRAIRERGACCLGFLQSPFSTFCIQRQGRRRIVTPESSHLEQTGKTVEHPYHFRYQFEPMDDPSAILWFCREYLHSEGMERIHFENEGAA